MKYLIQLIKLEEVDSLALEQEGVAHCTIDGQKYKQSVTAIQLTEGKVEALIALIDNIEQMATAIVAQTDAKVIQDQYDDLPLKETEETTLLTGETE